MLPHFQGNGIFPFLYKIVDFESEHQEGACKVFFPFHFLAVYPKIGTIVYPVKTQTDGFFDILWCECERSSEPPGFCKLFGVNVLHIDAKIGVFNIPVSGHAAKHGSRHNRIHPRRVVEVIFRNHAVINSCQFFAGLHFPSRRKVLYL